MPYTRPEGIVHVLAPSYRHFRTWCRNNGRRPRQMVFCPEAIYLHTPGKVEGLREPRVARVEGWEDGRYARDIWERLCAQDAFSYPEGRPLADLDWPWPEDSSGDVLETLGRMPEATRALTESLGRVGESMSYVNQTASQLTYSMIQAAMQAQPQYTYSNYVGRNCPCAQCRERSNPAARGYLQTDPPMREPQWLAEMRREQARSYYTSSNYGTAGYRQTTRTPPPEPEDAPDETGWYRPVSQRELNWTDWSSAENGTTVCAHVCGGDHQCEARATLTMEFTMPTGGLRRMPVCATCHRAETAALEEKGAGQ